MEREYKTFDSHRRLNTNTSMGEIAAMLGRIESKRKDLDEDLEEVIDLLMRKSTNLKGENYDLDRSFISLKRSI